MFFSSSSLSKTALREFRLENSATRQPCAIKSSKINSQGINRSLHFHGTPDFEHVALHRQLCKKNNFDSKEPVGVFLFFFAISFFKKRSACAHIYFLLPSTEETRPQCKSSPSNDIRSLKIPQFSFPKVFHALATRFAAKIDV